MMSYLISTIETVIDFSWINSFYKFLFVGVTNFENCNSGWMWSGFIGLRGVSKDFSLKKGVSFFSKDVHHFVSTNL